MYDMFLFHNSRAHTFHPFVVRIWVFFVHVSVDKTNGFGLEVKWAQAKAAKSHRDANSYCFFSDDDDEEDDDEEASEGSSLSKSSTFSRNMRSKGNELNMTFWYFNMAQMN